jgi:hypothetical protein
MVLNATSNNISLISWSSVFLVEETGVTIYSLLSIMLIIIKKDSAMTVIDHSELNKTLGGRRGRDHIVVGFTATYLISWWRKPEDPEKTTNCCKLLRSFIA